MDNRDKDGKATPNENEAWQFSQYLNETRVERSQDPSMYSKINETKYLLLSNITKKYLTCPFPPLHLKGSLRLCPTSVVAKQ